MKKILTLVLAICLIIPVSLGLTACGKDPMESWDGTTATVSEAVNGVITIETAEELAGVAKAVSEGETYEGVTLKLACDMDLKNKEWTPIGCGSSTADDIVTGKAFKGNFDGQNYTIYNLKVTEFVGGADVTGASRGVGLFGLTIDNEIKNLTLDTAHVEGNHYVGAMVGYSHTTTLTNLKVKNVEVVCNYFDEDESGDKAGALIGYASVATNITNCEAHASTVKAVRDAGRLIGVISETSSYADCVAGEDVVVSHNEGSAPSGYARDGQYLTNGFVSEKSYL